MSKDICVVMCTYNGEKYLKTQIDSLLAQEDVNVKIIAHDDGSKDSSADILSEYGIEVMGEGHMGPADGFLYLIENAGDHEYYALCDQDDEWDKDKLRIAAETLEKEPKQDIPLIYGSSTRLVDGDLNFLQDHILDSSRPMAARLFYSSISGNTMVFNRKMRDILVQHHPKKMVMHDSWIVKLCIAVGGRVIIDETPHINYRMHGNNVVGMELNFRQKVEKFKRIYKSKGEGQELIDICRAYEGKTEEWVNDLAAATLALRTDKGSRKNFMKKYGIDFNNKGFNIAFAIKVKKGNL